jgi:hypothetical protein
VDRVRERIASNGEFTFVLNEPSGLGRELVIRGIALDMEKDDAMDSYGITDGSAGLRGDVIRTDNNDVIKLYAASLLSGIAGAFSSGANGLLGKERWRFGAGRKKGGDFSHWFPSEGRMGALWGGNLWMTEREVSALKVTFSPCVRGSITPARVRATSFQAKTVVDETNASPPYISGASPANASALGFSMMNASCVERCRRPGAKRKNLTAYGIAGSKPFRLIGAR